MIEATRYLRWDGVCRADAVARPGDVNANPGAPGPQGEAPDDLQLHPSSELGRGGTASIMRFEVFIVAVEPAFWPGKEWVPIKVRFKAIDELTSLVLQIRTSRGELVYVEKLSAAQVWGLPEQLDKKDDPKPVAPVEGSPDHLADPRAGPYRVTVFVAKGGAEIALDQDDFARPPKDVARNPEAPRPEGSAMAIDRTLPRAIELLAVDHHFAPSRTRLTERLQIRSFVSAVSDLDVKIRITSESYPHDDGVVYEAPLADKTLGEHTDRWNGLSTARNGPLKDRLVTPLDGPFKVKLVIEGVAETEERITHVLYRGVKLERGSYIDDPEAPPAPGATPEYVQYILNELGYFAGPVKDAMTPQGSRALKRYSYAAPNYMEDDDLHQKSLDASETPVSTAMANGLQRRAIFSDPACLSDPSVASRIFVDHNYFYQTLAQFSADDSHLAREAAVLDRFEVPIRASVLLLSRDDPDGKGPGVEAGEAAGAVDVRWHVIDPPEDLSGCPEWTEDSPSRTRRYQEQILATIASRPDDPVDRGDNCPPAPGNSGFRGDPDHFLAGADLPPFETRVAGAHVLTKVHQGPAGHPRHVGTAAALFRASHVGGDNFVVEASVHLATHARAADLRKAHEQALGDAYEKVIAGRTGTMTVWRRHRVSAVVDWCTTKAPPIFWPDVRGVYARAFIELDTSETQYLTMRAVMDGGLGRQANRGFLFSEYVNDHQDIKGEDIAHTDDCVYSGPPLPAQGADESGEQYKARVDALLSDYLSTDHLMSIGTVFRKFVRSTDAAGMVLMRVDWCRPVSVRHQGRFVFSPSTTEIYSPKVRCIGLPLGVTMYPNSYLVELDSHFVVAHEMGHNMFLRHHETRWQVDARPPKTGKVASDSPVYDNPFEHDLEDHNCTMSYPWGVVTRNPPKTKTPLSWDRGTTQKPYFCGKCVLKLRGWSIRGLSTRST